MPITPQELGIDPTFLPQGGLKPLQVGQWDRQANTAQRRFIQGIFTDKEPTLETVFSSVASFFTNTAGAHVQLWRSTQDPTMFIEGTDFQGDPKAVSIIDTIRSGRFEDPWQALSSLLKTTYTWSLHQERNRLIRMGYKDDDSPAAMLLGHLDNASLNTPFTGIEILAEIMNHHGLTSMVS